MKSSEPDSFLRKNPNKKSCGAEKIRSVPHIFSFYPIEYSEAYPE